MADDSTRADFASWLAAHERRLLKTAWLLTGDATLAQDLVQTALMRCWPSWNRVSSMADPYAYVRRALINSHVSWWRRRRIVDITVGSLPERAAAPEPDQGLSSPVLAALSRLPKGQRAVVVLRFAEDQSEAQTAQLLGCSVGTVKSQTSRALKALRADAALLREVDLA